VLTALEPQIGAFWYGLPLKDFASHFCWSCPTGPENRIGGYGMVRRPGFPNWSWAGWKHPTPAIISLWPNHRLPNVPDLSISFYRRTSSGDFECLARTVLDLELDGVGQTQGDSDANLVLIYDSLSAIIVITRVQEGQH
jgi:hypothetical protein